MPENKNISDLTKSNTSLDGFWSKFPESERAEIAVYAFEIFACVAQIYRVKAEIEKIIVNGQAYRSNVKAQVEAIEKCQKVRHENVDKILKVLDTKRELPQNIKDKLYLEVVKNLTLDYSISAPPN